MIAWLLLAVSQKEDMDAELNRDPTISDGVEELVRVEAVVIVDTAVAELFFPTGASALHVKVGKVRELGDGDFEIVLQPEANLFTFQRQRHPIFGADKLIAAGAALNRFVVADPVTIMGNRWVAILLADSPVGACALFCRQTILSDPERRERSLGHQGKAAVSFGALTLEFNSQKISFFGIVLFDTAEMFEGRTHSGRSASNCGIE